MPDLRENSNSSAADEVYARIGATIRRRRKDELGMTQGALAEQVGLSRASIANIEAGEQGISVVLLITLARALDLQAEALIGAARDGELTRPTPRLPEKAAKHLRDDEWSWASSVLGDREAARS